MPERNAAAALAWMRDARKALYKRRGQAHYLGYGSGLGEGCRKPAQPFYLICTRFCHCWFSWQMNSIISEPSATICCSTLRVKGFV
jgi:hypothetical protein